MDRCFIDGIEYDRTTILLRAVSQIHQLPDFLCSMPVVVRPDGGYVQGEVSAEADLETSNPELIAKLFDACFSFERVEVQIIGRSESKSSKALIVFDGLHIIDTARASFKLVFGEAIQFTAKPAQKGK